MLSAQPNAPAFSFGWRGGTRGTLSLAMPVVGELSVPGFSFAVLPLIELRNERSALPVPFQFWRGRVAGEATWRWASSLGVTLGLEHESDHVTTLPGSADPVPLSDYLAINDLAVGADYTFLLGGAEAMALTPQLTARLLFLSCTRREVPCELPKGDTSAELAAGAVLQGLGSGLRPYASLHLSYLFPRGQIGLERRALVQIGLRYRNSASTRMLQLFFTALAGNDVGLLREASVLQGGVGVRWSL